MSRYQFPGVVVFLRKVLQGNAGGNRARRCSLLPAVASTILLLFLLVLSFIVATAGTTARTIPAFLLQVASLLVFFT